MSTTDPTVGEVLATARCEPMELVGLGDRKAGGGFDVGTRHPFVIEWTRVVDEPHRGRIEALLRALPAGAQDRCHFPTFGLRLGAAPDDLCISLCFECNNAYYPGGDAAFDASSPAAIELLALLRALAPTT